MTAFITAGVRDSYAVCHIPTGVMELLESLAEFCLTRVLAFIFYKKMVFKKKIKNNSLFKKILKDVCTKQNF